MKFLLLILTLFIFGCSIEKRIHRSGFHFTKNSTFQSSKKEKSKSTKDFKIASSIDSNRTSRPSQVERTTEEDRFRTKHLFEKRKLKKSKHVIPSAQTREKIKGIDEQKDVDITSSNEKTREPINEQREAINEQKEPDKDTSTLVAIANLLAIISFVFAILTVVSTALAFILSLTLILPLLPALVAFFSGGLSLILGLPTKQENYKSRLATNGLITSLIFFGFFIAILTGVIYI